MSFVAYGVDGWSGLVRADWQAEFSTCEPLTWVQRHPHQCVRQRLSRQIDRVECQRGGVYVKTMTAPNERAAQGRDRWALLKWRWQSSRAVRTLKICQEMLAEGLGCPAPVLAARRRGVDVFISEAVDLPRLRDRVRDAADVDQRLALLRAAGPWIATLHQRRFVHGDLLPNNLHVSESLDRVYFLDNDRTRRWPTALPDRLIRQNLEQFCFRVRKYGPEAPRAFLESYAQAAGWSDARTQKNVRQVMQAIGSRSAAREEDVD